MNFYLAQYVTPRTTRVVLFCFLVRKYSVLCVINSGLVS